jgi:WXG100 family type VII secretion target
MAGGGGFRTEDGAINKGAGLVSTARSDLTSMLSTLRAEVAQNAASWKGTAAGEFTKLMQRWDEDANLLTKALDEFENNLRGTDKNYQQIEGEAQETMTKLMNKLG